MYLKRILFFLLVCLSGQGFSQNSIPIGTWRVHAPYFSVDNIAIGDNNVYAASPYVSFFWDKSENSISSLSKIEGLSGVGISAIAFDNATSTVVFAYENGSIDLIKGRDIINIPDIVRSSIIIGSKKINHISFHKGRAYLSADFGVVVLDLSRMEIRESYLNLTASGSPNSVYSSAIMESKDSIFIATGSGVLSARLASSVNLMDFQNWHLNTISDGIPENGITELAYFNGRIYAGKSGDGIYEYINGSWTKKDWVGEGLPIYGMNASGGSLLVCADGKVFRIDNNYSLTVYDSYLGIFRPVKALLDENENLWIADKDKGLVQYNGVEYLNHISSSPASHHSFKLYAYEDKILNLTGSYSRTFDNAFRNSGFHVFRDNVWSTTSTYYIPDFPDARDLVDVVFDPADKMLYIASYQHGLLTVSSDNKYTLTGASRFRPVFDNVIRVSGVALDSKSNLWISNHGVSGGTPSVFMKERNGAWKSFMFPQTEARYPLDIVVDNFDNKWIRLGAGATIRGLLVFNENGNRTRFINTAMGSGGLPNVNVNCMAKDRNGEIWIGTNEGVAVFPNPGQIFDVNQSAVIPIFEGFPVLRDQVITAIKVDGANRKWFGTTNGVWLLDRSAKEELHNFNVDNSPLPSNIISSIEIHPTTGEVFFGTDKGIVSFRGSATEAGNQHNNVKVFPNPVKQGFSGTIGITGLAFNSSVKITDIYGNLIAEGNSEGGMFTWNGRNYNGVQARAGVYLVFSSTQDGEDANVAKILVIQ